MWPSLFDTSLREFDLQIEYCNSLVIPPSLETTYTALHLLSKLIAFLTASAIAIMVVVMTNEILMKLDQVNSANLLFEVRFFLF